MTTADSSPVAAKAAVRAEIRAARRARTESDRVQAAGNIADRVLPLLVDSPTVACYLSVPAEPGTAAIITLLRQRNARVLLPRVCGEALEWIELTDSTAFSESSLGISEPEGEALADALTECDAIVLPALAISVDGIRLGQGGGFYDRALQDVPTHSDGGPLLIGLLFDDEIVAALPAEDHDCRLDLAITPERILSF